MSQGSILDPLLFEIFLCNFYFFLHDVRVATYTDDNSPYCTGLKIVSNVLIKLENETFLQKFKDDKMIENADKNHLIINNNKEGFLNKDW